MIVVFRNSIQLEVEFDTKVIVWQLRVVQKITPPPEIRLILPLTAASGLLVVPFSRNINNLHIFVVRFKCDRGELPLLLIHKLQVIISVPESRYLHRNAVDSRVVLNRNAAIYCYHVESVERLMLLDLSRDDEDISRVARCGRNASRSLPPDAGDDRQSSKRRTDIYD